MFQIIVQWLQDSRVALHKVAALSCGLLVEVEGAAFSRHLATVLPIIEHHIHPDKYQEVGHLRNKFVSKSALIPLIPIQAFRVKSWVPLLKVGVSGQGKSSHWL